MFVAVDFCYTLVTATHSFKSRYIWSTPTSRLVCTLPPSECSKSLRKLSIDNHGSQLTSKCILHNTCVWTQVCPWPVPCNLFLTFDKNGGCKLTSKVVNLQPGFGQNEEISVVVNWQPRLSINFLEWKEESFRLKERHSFGNIALILLFIF